MERITAVLVSSACAVLVLRRRSTRRHAALAARIATLEAELAEARLLEHRARINPHMLMNALNSMSVLAEEEGAPRVHDAAARLALLLRMTLEQGAPLTTLRSEVSFVERYLDVERVRFAEQLRVQWSVGPGCDDAVVPTLILQPIVENAIRHGRTPRTGGIDITIGARRHADRLQLWVADRGAGLGNGGRTGFGLGSTRRQLDLLFDDAYSLDISHGRDAGVIVTVTLPLNLNGNGNADQNAARG